MSTDRERLMETLDRCLPGVGGDHLWLRVEGAVNLSAMTEAIIRSGWRPPVRVIESDKELDALPVGAVVMDSPYPEGDVHQRKSDGRWAEVGVDTPFRTGVLRLPAVLLWSPTEKARPTA